MLQSGSQSLPIAAAFAAYLLGIRHAFDVDHIVAIDNTTRLLRSQNRPAGSVGFWFSLGHSSVVLVACLLLGIGWGSLSFHGLEGGSAGTTAAGMWGPAVSGTFLMILAVVNGRILLALWRRRHEPVSSSNASAMRGFVTRFLGPQWSARRPRQMVIVGFLFGLGFDTVVSVGLLILSVSGVVVPWSTFVALPVLFAAGMTLCDGLNGYAMNHVYAWADAGDRRVGYNLAVTALSVFAASGIGALTLIGLLDAIH